MFGQQAGRKERDGVIGGGVVLGNVAVARNLTGNARHQPWCSSARGARARQSGTLHRQPRVQQGDVAVVRADAHVGFAFGGKLHRSKQSCAQFVTEYMTIKSLDQRQDDTEKLAPIGVVVAPLAVAHAAVIVDRAGVGL